MRKKLINCDLGKCLMTNSNVDQNDKSGLLLSPQQLAPAGNLNISIHLNIFDCSLSSLMVLFMLLSLSTGDISHINEWHNVNISNICLI
jgi:hypothetical protein